MDGTTAHAIDLSTFEFPAFPDGIQSRPTVLIAAPFDPTPYAIDLRALCRYGHAGEPALVVTTTASADVSIEAYETVCSDSDRPSLGIVDTISARQSMSDPYRRTPVVYTPAPGDLERTVLALSELTDGRSQSIGTRHLVVRSLTPMIEATSSAQVCAILDRISGLRVGSGRCLLGIAYTAHDEETMSALAERVDGILWVTEGSENQLTFEFRTTSGRYTRSLSTTGPDG